MASLQSSPVLNRDNAATKEGVAQNIGDSKVRKPQPLTPGNLNTRHGGTWPWGNPCLSLPGIRSDHEEGLWLLAASQSSPEDLRQNGEKLRQLPSPPVRPRDKETVISISGEWRPWLHTSIGLPLTPTPIPWRAGEPGTDRGHFQMFFKAALRARQGRLMGHHSSEPGAVSPPQLASLYTSAPQQHLFPKPPLLASLLSFMQRHHL